MDEHNTLFSKFMSTMADFKASQSMPNTVAQLAPANYLGCLRGIKPKLKLNVNEVLYFLENKTRAEAAIAQTQDLIAYIPDSGVTLVDDLFPDFGSTSEPVETNENVMEELNPFFDHEGNLFVNAIPLRKLQLEKTAKKGKISVARTSKTKSKSRKNSNKKSTRSKKQSDFPIELAHNFRINN